jgi:2,3-bisphosphoglycerate-independent phosphoglycerate mutase
MVGHSGILSAAIKAVEAVDTCLGRVIDAVREKGGTAFVTADHGNAELMADPQTGAPFTAHTTTPVMAVLVNAPAYVKGLNDGRLCDIAPTLLELLEVKQPADMCGISLIKKG